MNIEIRIERLVLDGLELDAHQTSALRTVVIEQMERMLASQDPSPVLREEPVHRAVGRDLQMLAHIDISELGVQLAQSVLETITSEVGGRAQNGRAQFRQ